MDEYNDEKGYKAEITSFGIRFKDRDGNTHETLEHFYPGITDDTICYKSIVISKVYDIDGNLISESKNE